jgi:hypothetical protein
MTAALAEPLDAITTNPAGSTTARAEASRANGRLSHGPISPEGKARSRRNGCKDGLTGAGIVLPPAATAEVDRREAEFVQDLRPRNPVERELIRQMAVAAWRGRELGLRIIQHDARMNAARFANWEQDEQIAAAELGRRLADDPEAVVAQLERSSAGCDWLIRRWDLLGDALSSTEEGDDEPGCAWTDADLALALDMLGRPAALRHLDHQASRLESLREQARLGSDEAVTELREIIARQLGELDARRDEVWAGVEQSILQGWRAGAELDLGPEGTRLRRYEAAADRLFRSAWTKLERLRQERGEPLSDRSAASSSPEHVPPPLSAAAPPPAPPPARPVPAVPERSLPGNSGAAVLDFWAAGPPRSDIDAGFPVRDKTNPRPGKPAGGRQAVAAGNRSPGA